jgi:hypothetical protein
MHELIAWCGFLGAWLLFAGPIYQASLELRELEVQREDIEAATEGISQPPPVSAWWWLVPPVKYVFERRRNRAFRRDVMQALPPRELEGLITYLNKATGWLMVGAGGLLIAVNETGELVETYERWPVWVFWALFVAMLLIAVGFVSLRMRHGTQMIEAVAVREPAADGLGRTEPT